MSKIVRIGWAPTIAIASVVASFALLPTTAHAGPVPLPACVAPACTLNSNGTRPVCSKRGCYAPAWFKGWTVHDQATPGIKFIPWINGYARFSQDAGNVLVYPVDAQYKRRDTHTSKWGLVKVDYGGIGKHFVVA